MKNILLSSAAIVAIAGAASAEVSWSGDAELGYNDDVEGGVYWSAGLGVDLSQELNNGWTASASLDIDLANDTSFDLGSVDSSDWVLTIENDMFALSFGDIDTAYASFSGVSELDAAVGILEDALIAFEVEGGDPDYSIELLSDEAADYDGAEGGVLLTGSFGNFTAATSVILGDEGETGAAQLFVGGEFGAVDFGVFYGEETVAIDGEATNQIETLALSLGTTLGGADIDFGYMQNSVGGADVDAYGIEVAYPVGDTVTLGAFYTDYDVDGADADAAYGVSVDYEDGPIAISAFWSQVNGYADQGTVATADDAIESSEEYGIEGSYDVGNGLVIFAGYVDDGSDGGYVAAEYDLGGGATFLASYADAESEGNDEVGDPEFNDGLTLELSLEF